MEKKNNIKLKNNITFGILFSVLFFLVAIYPLKMGDPIRLWSLILSLVFLFITIVKPNLFTSLNSFWIEFGTLLGKVISPIIMGLIFFFIIVPTGIFVRILKKDIMVSKREATSYWIDKKDKVQSMKKQF